MDWFLYDNGLRHERVNYCNFFNSVNIRSEIWSRPLKMMFQSVISTQILVNITTLNAFSKVLTLKITETSLKFFLTKKVNKRTNKFLI